MQDCTLWSYICIKWKLEIRSSKPEYWLTIDWQFHSHLAVYFFRTDDPASLSDDGQKLDISSEEVHLPVCTKLSLVSQYSGFEEQISEIYISTNLMNLCKHDKDI